MNTYTIIASNDWLNEPLKIPYFFYGTRLEMESHISDIWNEHFAYLADHGNAIRAYEGDELVHEIRDYTDEDDEDD